MDGWISATAILKIVTACIALSAAINRSKRTKLQWIMNAAALALILSLHASAGGYRDVAANLAGAILGVLLAVPLRRARWMTRTDMSTCCVVGAQLEPAGFAIAFGIAVGFIAVQRLLRARTAAMTDPFIPAAPFYPMMHPRGATRPSLAEMESQRMLREDAAEGIAFGDGDNDGGTHAACIPILRDRDEVLPWPHTIALATLAVMMFGVPW